MTTDRLDMKSIDFVSKNIESIAELFPNCITETSEGKRIDFTLLQQELSGDIVDGAKERYRLEWAGKREAIVNANLRTTNTLRPIREDSVDFDKTENIYIEGDNLEVLKILQESYLNKIKMIYIDPPYNTGNDFIYKDDFKKSVDELNLEEGNIDEQRNRLVANSNSSGRYHSDWLSMMYPRLKLARNLLTEDGVIFISIDDNEVHNLRKICDEIFGEDNFRNNIIIKRGTKSVQAQFENIDKLGIACEFILCYSKNSNTRLPHFYFELDEIREGTWNNHWRGTDRPTMRYEILGITPSKGQWRWGKERSLKAIDNYKKCVDELQSNNKELNQTNIDIWYYENATFNNIEIDLLRLSKNNKPEHYIAPTNKKYGNNLWDDLLVNGTSELNILNSNVFDNPKNTKIIDRISKWITNKDSIILDFFSGSGTTGHAVMQLNSEDGGNRKFIMVQIPEECDEKSEAFKAGYKNICEIGKERIRRAGKKIIEQQKLVLESKKGELDRKLNGQRSLDDESVIEELRQEIESIEKKIKRLDCGFRVFRLDSSNMKDVYYMPKDYKQENLELFATNIKEDRETEDLIAQVMLDWGLELSKRIEKVEVAGKEVYKIENNALYCCFDEEIDEKFIRELAKQESHPLRIVFKDSSFKDDTAKENVAQLIKQLCPETEIKVI